MPADYRNFGVMEAELLKIEVSGSGEASGASNDHAGGTGASRRSRSISQRPAGPGGAVVK